jgi:hypothetical protein
MLTDSENSNYITLSKRRYHEHRDMVDWCSEHIGPGGWSWDTPKTWEDMGNKIWVVFGVFGNITFFFKDPKHLTYFILKWGTA